MTSPPAKLALSAAVFLLLAGGLEGGLRLAGFAHPPAPPIVVWGEWEDKVLRRERGLHVADPDCLWIPRANNPIRRPPIGVEGSDETVNAHGFRGPALERARTDDVLRVATLGDSSTFGFGVRWEDTFSAQLAARLAADGTACEVLCAGVVGYSVVQGVERYRRDVRPYAPDVVVAAFGAVNEGFDVERSDRDKIAWQRARGSDTWRRWQERSRVVQLAAWLREGGSSAARGGDADERVPRVSVDAFEAELLALAELVAADGARLIVVSMPRTASVEERRPHLPPYTERLIAVARREGWTLVDAHGPFRAREEGSGDAAQTWMLDGFHPAPPGHAHLAERIAAAIGAVAVEAGTGGAR